MNNKHTPGEWLVMGNQRNGHFDFVLPMADDEDFQANAALIAAAPCLLSALEGILDRYTGLVNSGDAGNWDPEDEDVVKQARAAIKKSRGEI